MAVEIAGRHRLGQRAVAGDGRLAVGDPPLVQPERAGHQAAQLARDLDVALPAAVQPLRRAEVRPQPGANARSMSAALPLTRRLRVSGEASSIVSPYLRSAAHGLHGVGNDGVPARELVTPDRVPGYGLGQRGSLERDGDLDALARIDPRSQDRVPLAWPATAGQHDMRFHRSLRSRRRTRPRELAQRTQMTRPTPWSSVPASLGTTCPRSEQGESPLAPGPRQGSTASQGHKARQGKPWQPGAGAARGVWQCTPAGAPLCVSSAEP